MPPYALPLLPWEGPAILLVDLDAFFASVEQLDHPAWRGKPVIVGGDPDRHGVVATASYEARAFGIHSAMPSSEAHRLCPSALWGRGRFGRYREVSCAVMRILQDETPHVQQVSIDEAFLDVSPTKVNHEHPQIIAQRIQQRIEKLGISCSIGVATSKTVAKIASEMDKPRGLTVVYPGGEPRFLAPLSLRSMSGIGPVAEEKLTAWGIKTLGQLAQMDEATLISLLGKQGSVVYLRARGKDDSPVKQDKTVKSLSSEMTFAHTVSTVKEVHGAIGSLAAKVGRRLRQKGLSGQTLRLRVKFKDRHTRSTQQRLAHVSHDELFFTPYLYEMLDRLWFPGVELLLVGVGMSDFEEPDEKHSLFETEENFLVGCSASYAMRSPVKRQGLLNATDRVKNRFGEASVMFGRDLRCQENTTGSSAKNPTDYE